MLRSRRASPLAYAGAILILSWWRKDARTKRSGKVGGSWERIWMEGELQGSKALAHTSNKGPLNYGRDRHANWGRRASTQRVLSAGCRVRCRGFLSYQSTSRVSLLHSSFTLMPASRKYLLVYSGVTACSITITRNPFDHSPNSLASSLFLCIHFLRPLKNYSKHSYRGECGRGHSDTK